MPFRVRRLPPRRPPLLATLTKAGGGVTTLTVSGTLTPAGTLRWATTKLVAGSATPGGALRALVLSRGFAGTCAPAGTLLRIQLFIRAFAGSVPGAGALRALVAKALVPGAVNLLGALSPTAIRSVTGTVGSAGTLTQLRATVLVLAGAVGSVGTLSRQAALPFTGLVTPVGVAVKGLALHVSRLLEPTGALSRVLSRAPYQGTVGLSGTLATESGASIVLAGVIGVSGTLRALVDALLTGDVAPAGAVTHTSDKRLEGFLPSSGALLPWELSQTVAGQVTPTGTLSKGLATPVLAGAVGASGAVATEVFLTLTGVVGAVGSLAFLSVTTLVCSGLVGLVGTLTSSLAVIRGRIQLYQRRLRGGGLDPHALTGGGLTDREID